MDGMASSMMLMVGTESDHSEVAASLAGEGIQVRYAAKGQQALTMAAADPPTIIVAETPLVDMPSVEFISSIREWSLLPIIAVSDNGRYEAKAALLNAGADDYLVKPFGLDEFRARVRVAFRHRRLQEREYGPIFTMGGTVVNLANHTVEKDDKPIRLAPIEFHLLAELVKQAGKVVTQRHLLLKVWSHSSRSNLPVLRAYIAILRKKLSTYPTGDIVIETIPGVGYRLFHTWSE